MRFDTDVLQIGEISESIGVGDFQEDIAGVGIAVLNTSAMKVSEGLSGGGEDAVELRVVLLAENVFKRNYRAERGGDE